MLDGNIKMCKNSKNVHKKDICSKLRLCHVTEMGQHNQKQDNMTAFIAFHQFAL